MILKEKMFPRGTGNHTLLPACAFGLTGLSALSNMAHSASMIAPLNCLVSAVGLPNNDTI